MYLTYVVRPADAPEGKGPQFQPFWDGIMDYNLRGGFALQFLGFSCILVASMMGGNIFQIFDVLSGEPDALKTVPIFFASVGGLFWTIGAVWIHNFSSIIDDDASMSQTRGYRAGIKCLHQASLINILSSAMTTVLFFSYMNFFDDYWTSKEVGSGSTTIYACIARTLHAISCLLYSASFFFIENFHHEGTSEIWGCTLATVYATSGFFEIIALVFNWPSLHLMANICFTLLLGGANIASLLWALQFEVIATNTNVKLTQSAIRNEYYKSQNAIAYYGPSAGTVMSPEGEA